MTGISDDVTYLKEQLQSLENGATAEQIATLTATVDSIATNASASATALTTIGTTLTDLDAQTTRPTTEG